MAIKKPITDVANLPPMFKEFDVYLVTVKTGQTRPTSELKGTVKALSATHAQTVVALKKFGRIRSSPQRAVSYEARPAKAKK